MYCVSEGVDLRWNSYSLFIERMNVSRETKF